MTDTAQRIASDRFDVAIVGGGAAGLAAAIFAARGNSGLSIVLLDGAKKLGAKILVSGGGRCNVTNKVVTEADFFGGSRNVVRRILRAFTAEEAVVFFRELGVALHEEEHGKLFPDSNSAHTVLDAMVSEAHRLGIRMRTSHRVIAIKKDGTGYQVTASVPVLEQQSTIFSPRLVLATGGKSLPKTGSDGAGYEFAKSLGHSIVPTTPALAPLVLDGDFHKPLSGIAHDVELVLKARNSKQDTGMEARGHEGTKARRDGGTKEQRNEGMKQPSEGATDDVLTFRRFDVSTFPPVRLRGALLWTHFGISGPVVLNMSGVWHRAILEGRAVSLFANFLPDDRFETAEQMLIATAKQQPRTHLGNALGMILPARLATALLAALAIKGDTPMAHLSRDERRKLILALLEWPLAVRDSRGYAYAEVTAGGVPLDEIDPATMESRKSPGLYLVGEILDVDGRIGGYNFQWAWSTAHVAARALSQPFTC